MYVTLYIMCVLHAAMPLGEIEDDLVAELSHGWLYSLLCSLLVIFSTYLNLGINQYSKNYQLSVASICKFLCLNTE